MTNETHHIRQGVDRRMLPRRSEDFEKCPKFDKHELTIDQIELIAELAAKKAMKMMSDEKDIEFAKFVKKIGFSWGEKVLFVVGLLIIWVIGWATNNGFKF